MAAVLTTISLDERLAEKERDREADARALRDRAKSSEQLRRENGACAFSRAVARINLPAAKSLF